MQIPSHSYKETEKVDFIKVEHRITVPRGWREQGRG
jgi:hypothetical protein